jgi:hypothetical protein
MAGQLPSFITGANAKIKVGNLTMAYAQDVSYSIEVSTIPVETIGRYEVVTNEPIAYYVSGTLSVIRYTKSAANVTGADKVLSGVNKTGNSINNWNDDTGAGNIGKHFDPGQLLTSKTFDLEIIAKISGDAGGPVAAGATPNPAGSTSGESVIKIRDCRLTRKQGSVTKRGLIVDQFAFSAVLADNDDENAVSGSGDSDLR